MLLFPFLHKSHLEFLTFPLLLGTILFLVLFRRFLSPLLEGLLHPLSEEPTLVEPLNLSHLITKFLLVDNFTLEAKHNPFLEVKSQLGHNP